MNKSQKSKRLFLAAVLTLLSVATVSGQYHRSRGAEPSAASAPPPAAAPSATSSSGSSGGSSGVLYSPSPSGSSGDPWDRGHGGAMSVNRMRDPYRFSGQVDMPDGTPPAEPPTIQSVCGGRVQTVAYCDRRGRFDFDLLNNPWGLDPRFQAMSFGYWSGYPDLSGCGFRAYLPGYYSPLFSLTGRGPYDWPGIGKFKLKQPPGVEGATVSVTTLAAPKEARKHFEKALRLLKDARPEKAAAELELAVEEYPEYAAAWSLLGEVRQALHYESGVREAYERALEADWRYIRPYAPLIRLAIADENYREAAELADKAVRLNPLSAELHYHNGLANYRLGNLDAAVLSLSRAVKSDDIAEVPDAHVLYAQMLAKEGKTEEAADQIQAFLALRPNSELAPSLRARLQSWGLKPEPGAENAQAVK